MLYKNINNAIIENRNKIIKNIKHASNGFKTSIDSEIESYTHYVMTVHID